MRQSFIVPINFILMLGKVKMGFQKISGIGRQQDVLWIQEGGVNDHAIALRAPQNSPCQLKFERGVLMADDSKYMKDIFQKYIIGDLFVVPRDIVDSNLAGSILVTSSKDTSTVAQYDFQCGGILDWSISDLDAQGSSPLIETFTIAHYGLKRKYS